KLKQERKISTSISINRVMDFLSSPDGKPYLNKHFDWISTRNAFLAWRFNMDQGTIKDYFYRANKKSSPDHEIDRNFFFPSVHKKYNFSAFSIGASVPTVAANKNDIEEEF